MITVTANITFKDLLNYNFYKYYKNPVQLILQIAIGLLVIVWLVSFLINYPIDSTFSLVAGACLFQFGLIVPFRIYLSSRKEYKIKKEFHAPIEYVFTEDGMASKTAFSNNFNKWEVLDKIIEEKRWFIFYFSKYVATLVPKNSFTSNEQVQNFKELIKRRTKFKELVRK